MHVYITPSRGMQEMISYFVHSRGGWQVTPVRVSLAPPLNVVTEGQRMKKRSLKFNSDEYEFLVSCMFDLHFSARSEIYIRPVF